MKLKLFIIILLTPILSLADNAFLVAPGHVTFNLSHPDTQTFLVLNNGDQIIHIRADLKYYKPNSSILKLGQPIKSNFDDNLVPNLIISPPVLVLRPGEQRKLRVSVLPPATLNPGSYRAYVKFSMLEFSQTHHHITTKNNKSLSISINFHLNTIVSIYGNKGQGNASLKLNCKKEKNGIRLTATNSTHWIGINTVYANKKAVYTLVSLPYTHQTIQLSTHASSLMLKPYNKQLNQRIQCGK